MQPEQWRELARAALSEMSSMGLDGATEAQVRERLESALALPDDDAAERIREVLQSRPELRAWLDSRRPAETAAAAPVEAPLPAPTMPPPAPSAPAAPPQRQGQQSRPPRGAPPPPASRRGGVFSRLRDALTPKMEPRSTPPDTHGAEPPTANGGPPPMPADDFLLGGDTGDIPPVETTGAPPPETVSGGGAAEPPTVAERVWRADVDEPGTPLAVGVERTLSVSVGESSADAIAFTDFDESLVEADPTTQLFDLTVQLDSEDVDIVGVAEQPLQVPRQGASPAPARFAIRPRHDGDCVVTATVHRQGNFVTQLRLTLPVGASGTATMTALGRPPESVAVLEPRDLSLILQPAPGGGYLCTAVGRQAAMVTLPITTDELTHAVAAVQGALFDVVRAVDEQGNPVFQQQVDIPAAMADKALETMARAGARLFQQLFLHPGAGQDAAQLGQWLRDEAASPGVRLNLQVVASSAPLPWSLLYLGDAAQGATLDWSHFLGVRHVVEQIPLQPRLSAQDARIRSSPRLSVGLNLNQTIDQQFNATWVADHEQRWTTLATQRHGLALLPRTTRGSVLAALADPATQDQILYFYCHATSGGSDGDPDQAAIVMGQADPLRLGDLNLDAPTTVQLAGSPLVFLNACESADLDPRFYAGWVPYFMAKGARGVIGTECRTPALFAVRFAEAFFDRVLDGVPIGEAMLATRAAFLEQHRNPLGLLYAVHCDADTRIDPALAAAG